MLILGIILIVVGKVVPVAVLFTIGLILAIIGLALLLIDLAGHPVGGRRLY